MIIENPEALNAWLLKSLEKLCEADPAALAKYVMALVKKDKPEKELREFCCDQLEIFLSGHTKPFVELLFNALKSKCYLQPQSTLPTVSSMPPTENNANFPIAADTAVSDLSGTSMYQLSSSVAIHNRTSSDTQASFGMNSGNGLLTNTDIIRNDALPGVEHEEAVKREHLLRSPSPDFERKESRRSFRKRSRSLSTSSDSSASYRARRRSRGSDGSGNRSFPQKYPNRQEDGRRHGNERGYDDFDSLERGRDRKNKTELFKRRKHSPSSGVRSRSCSSEGNYFGSSRSRSRSRSRSDSRTRSKEMHPSSTDGHQEVESQKPSVHSSIDYRDQSPLSDSAQSSGAYEGSRRRKPVKRIAKRCKDYDEKGFCMQGEFCPYDHGVDPLVVEDVTVLNYGSPTSRPPPAFPPEPYNPEAPGMFQPKSSALPPWPYNAPPPPAPFPLPSVIGRIPQFDPSKPPPRLPFHSKVPMTRELITVPTLDIGTTSNMLPTISSAVNVPGSRDMSGGNEEDNSIANTSEVSSLPPSYVHREPPPFKKRNFDHIRGGRGRRPMNKWSERCTLELRKVPRHLNSSDLLNAHFSKFGKIKISVCGYDNDSEAALVVFETNASANAAYRSSEPVLNNRFIKVFWHNTDSRSPTLLSLPSKEESKGHVSVEEFAGRVGDDHTSVAHSVKEKMVTKPLLTIVKNEVIEPSETPSVAIPSPVTPFVQPKMLRKSSYSSVATTGNPKPDPQKETMKKRLELLKKMQSTLQNLIENQKLFLDKYSTSKSEKEKQFLKESIESTDQKIRDLKDSIKKESEGTLSSGKSPSVELGGNGVEIKKQLLDAEMDLYKMQHSGDDVTELVEKVRLLKQKVLSLGILDPKGLPLIRGSTTTIRGRGVVRGKRNMLVSTSRRVDHRPKKLQILNAHGLDKTDLINHFAQFGHVEGLVLDGIGALVAFKTRKDAEAALAMGSRCGPFILNMVFYRDSIFNPEKVTVADTQETATPVAEEVQIEQEHSLEEEEDEDEDNESRSWRR